MECHGYPGQHSRGPEEKRSCRPDPYSIVKAIDARDGSGTVSYSLEKKPTKKWNMILGGQYQFNMRWQLRTEFGFFGGRTQGLFSANYRFGF